MVCCYWSFVQVYLVFNLYGHSWESLFPSRRLFILLIIILLSQIQPHKSAVSHYTKIDLTFYTLLALYYTCLSAANTAAVKSWYYTKGCYTLSVFIAFIPLIYISCLCVYWYSHEEDSTNTYQSNQSVVDWLWLSGWHSTTTQTSKPRTIHRTTNMTHVADTHAEWREECWPASACVLIIMIPTVVLYSVNITLHINN